MSSCIRLGAGALKELRIHLCQISPGSAGVREFIQKYYVDMKMHNPDFPILVRECQGVPARIWGRFDKGVEQSVAVDNLAAKDVLEALKKLSIAK